MTIFLLVGLALGVGFSLIFLTSFSKQRKPVVSESLLTRQQFDKIVLGLVDEMKLEVQESQSRADGLDLLAINPAPLVGGPLLIRSIYLRSEDRIDSPTIIEFSNLIVQERVMKGILVTTGQITPELSGIAELAPIDFIDGLRLATLIRKYQLPLL